MERETSIEAASRTCAYEYLGCSMGRLLVLEIRIGMPSALRSVSVAATCDVGPDEDAPIQGLGLGEYGRGGGGGAGHSTDC